ncbi:sex-determining region Y protein-like [Rhipicephalus sanguineus]|uniref:sex-determining region Y protein-like n=1 Tax=Rhipicephalus sanguineus TaxID=34632 RepID=UPI00189624FA|nr:sex-determining region Y protein-like [Rhipicephalus sanguineus]
MAVPSTSEVVRHSHQLWSRIPPPTNAFTQFAQEKRRSVSSEKLNEGNQRVSSRLGELWRSLSTVDKGPHQRNEADSAAVHRRRYSDCAFTQRGAHQRGEHERRISSKMSLPGSAPDVQGKGAAAQRFRELRPWWRQTAVAASIRPGRHHQEVQTPCSQG